jgi:hypothetical protein
MPNLKRYLKFGSKTANVPRITVNIKRKLNKHLKNQPKDLKAKEYLDSI